MGLIAVGCASSTTQTSTTSPEVEAAVDQVGSVTQALDYSKQIHGLAADLSRADSPAEADDAGQSLGEVAHQAVKLAGQDAVTGSAPDISRNLEKAGLKLQDAGTSLEQLAKAQALARRTLEHAHTASADVSNRLGGQAKQLERLDQTLDQSSASFGAALHQLHEAVHGLQRQLGEASAVDVSDATKQIADLRAEIAKLERQSDELFAQLGKSLSGLADDLSSRAVELEPDVVLDCTSQHYPNVADMSVRNMSCAEADAVTNSVIQVLGPGTFYVSGYSCSILGDYGPTDGSPILGASDIRCYTGDQAFRFSFGD